MSVILMILSEGERDPSSFLGCTLKVLALLFDLVSFLTAASVSASFPAAAPPPLPVPAPVAEEAERPRKKPRKKQEYVPGMGSANYAFIIVLYQVISPMCVCHMLCVACSTVMSQLGLVITQQCLDDRLHCTGTQAWGALSWKAGAL